MRRILEHANLRLRFVLRPDPRLVRKLPLILMLIAVALGGWVLELGSVLQGQAEVRDWSSVWVGLDLMEIAGLVLTAVLLRRRSAYLAAVAAMTATLFALDAWFDVLTAAAGASWYESLAAAVFGEIPMTALLTAIAVWATRERLEQHAMDGLHRRFDQEGARPGRAGDLAGQVHQGTAEERAPYPG